jgi:hypothetical protein
MSWLSSPKVRLALIVNGLYFISIFTPTTPHTRPRPFALASATRDARGASKRAPVFAPLPPPSGPSKATTWVNKEFDQLDVYLTNDLTLLKRPGHRLLFSPTFTTRASNPEAPETVLLRFVSYSDEQTFSNNTPLTISADGARVDDTANDLYSGNAGLHSVGEGDDGEVVETMGVTLPYEDFVEMVSARRVIIQLGPDRVVLTADQIEALRDMHRRLPQQPEDPPPPADKTRQPSAVGVGPRIHLAPSNTQPLKRQ